LGGGVARATWSEIINIVAGPWHVKSVTGATVDATAALAVGVISGKFERLDGNHAEDN